ncbi:MAG: alpha-glucosidase [Chloroflexota bacterium]
MDKTPWWQDGIIYQIYPRSFADSNADGLGDLPGIISRLDYLADLGIDAIWLSPVYPSPDADFGYDISDYTAIDPRFGSLADFDRLVAECHRRGIRVILDLVLNHTSDQHPWFQESRSNRENSKRDWYIWRDRPNNWQAAFGGKAWTADPQSGQYYLHLFTRNQPDLNWRNPQVRLAMLEVFRFWLERGVDGFRLDVFNTYFKHLDLADNPPKFGLRGFDRQRHIHDLDQPEMMPFLSEVRALLEVYPERYAVGETYLATREKTISYCGADKLQAAFSFDFTPSHLVYPWNPGWLMKQILRREDAFQQAGVWPTTVMSNHDIPRPASRYADGEDDAQAKLAMALLLTLRGTPFLYNGEEIGMRDISLGRQEILDPPGKKYWPIYKGRDGCRSPMQWDSTPNAGFSAASPWLPVHPNHTTRNVAVHQADPDSLLQFTKMLIALRKTYPALRRGDFLSLKAPRSGLAYLRRTEEQTILVAMNFSQRSISVELPEGEWYRLFPTNNGSLSHTGKLPLGPSGICLIVKQT